MSPATPGKSVRAWFANNSKRYVTRPTKSVHECTSL